MKRRDIQSLRVPGGNLTGGTVLSPAVKKEACKAHKKKKEDP